MISGFLISYVLVEKKAYSTIANFYFSRFLRLYPFYCVVALPTLLAYIFAAKAGSEIPFLKVYTSSPIAANFFLTVANTLIFFQDWVLFSGVQNGHLGFIYDFTKSEIPLYQGLLVPQAWTLGVELTFYLAAPFILYKKRTLVLLGFASIVLRIILIRIGLGKFDPWTYRFFPTELIFFILGALSHQLLLVRYNKILLTKKYSNLVVCVPIWLFIFLVLLYQLLPLSGPEKTICLFIIFLLIMPLAFVFQTSRKWDRWIGDLSYPTYICHMLVIFIIKSSINILGIKNESSLILGVTVVSISILFSIFLNRCLGEPIELLRNRLKLQ